ncbi:MAG: hypothetical protein V3U54_01385 [Thermodesulfobacteriota bacterium]
MNSIIQIKFLCCVVTILIVSCSVPKKVSISTNELNDVGKRIFQNEASGKNENLIVWNKGEDFASLGIGHFIWYPEGREGPFKESFPDFINFLTEKGIELPDWLGKNRELPWKDQKTLFMEREHNSYKYVSLNELLIRTIPYQAEFMFNRFITSLPIVLEAADQGRRKEIENKFFRVAHAPLGVYALMDYVNFKGEGTLETERYNCEGWGLLQVLEEMHGERVQIDVMEDFSNAACRVLIRRVHNSPPERNEQRWIIGWLNRVKTYFLDSE